MRIIQASSFARKIKKLHAKEKAALDEAVREVIADPEGGEGKIGDLTGVRVHKYRQAGQLYLLAYTYDPAGQTLTLIAHGPHENFYRDLKRQGH